MLPFEDLLGPFALTVGLLLLVWYGGRAVYKWVTEIWAEHLRVDHERDALLAAANARVDALRESNDANVKIMDRAVAQNERLVAAVLANSQRLDRGSDGS